MLIEFNVENYKSFQTDAKFSMVAAKIVSKDKSIDHNNVFEVDKRLSLLKSAVIYGANASGKSNFLAALRFMSLFVLDSSKDTQASEAIDIEPFRLSTETEDKPSLFEVVFFANKKKYRYGFEANTQEVVSEWLFVVARIQEKKLFVREDGVISVNKAFYQDEELVGRGLEKLTRNNALFLSVAAQFNNKIAQDILSWFRILVTSGPKTFNRNYTVSCLEDEQYSKEIIGLIKKLDLGIDDIQVETIEPDPSLIPKNISEATRQRFMKNMRRKTVLTSHWKYDKNNEKIPELFDIDTNESEGTRKLFALAGFLIDTLKKGKILFIDEFDSSIHPIITCAIIDLFNSKDSNPKNAQIIFITHDTNLLSNRIFRRDQIWFAEKDEKGATHLYSLVEYKVQSESSLEREPLKKVRNDASFEDDYIRGKYGAVPFIGDLHRLLGATDVE